MKAWQLQEIGKIKYTTVEDIHPEEDYVKVRVRACGICGSDIPRIYKNGAHRMPLIIGHEFAGEVVETGLNVDSSWNGKRVGIFPLIPCKQCTMCEQKKYEMCKNYGYLGSRQDGGFAEYVNVPVWNLIQLPDNASFEQAAMLEPMAVSVHAIRRVINESADLTDKTVAVIGLGTIGLMIIMMLKAKGIDNIIAIGSRDVQKSKAMDIGVAENCFCNSNEKDVSQFIDSMTGGNGVDVVFECVGKNDTVSQAIEIVAAGGNICMVGNPYSDMKLDKDVYWKILRSQINITGTWNSSFVKEADDDWHHVIQLLSDEQIHPEKLISHRFSLEDIKHGFEIMRDKSEDYTKIMMIN